MKKCILSSLVTMILLTGCGENNGENNQPAATNPPQVHYAPIDTAATEIKNFANADWLYDQYFGEYGFPVEFKASVIDEIRKVANGFALQFAKGEDVGQAIAEFQQGMLMLQASGQFNAMISQMSDDWYSGRHHQLNKAQEHPPVELKPNGELTQERIDQIKAVQAQVNADEEAYRRAQEELVKTYKLPYELPGHRDKYVIFSQEMKRGGGKNNRGNGNNSSQSTHQSKIHNWYWEPGAIIWSDGAGGIGHMGIVTTYNNSSVHNPNGPLSIVDANTDGVKIHEGTPALTAWQNNYNTVRSYFYNHNQGSRTEYGGTSTIPHDRRTDMALIAKSFVGQPYNWNFFDKNADNRTYCSQFIRTLYLRTISTDLDSDGGWVVWPNDIIEHPHIFMNQQSKKVSSGGNGGGGGGGGCTGLFAGLC